MQPSGLGRPSFAAPRSSSQAPPASSVAQRALGPSYPYSELSRKPKETPQQFFENYKRLKDVWGPKWQGRAKEEVEEEEEWDEDEGEWEEDDEGYWFQWVEGDDGEWYEEYADE